MRAPFPYFGGKARAADVIWERLGNVKHFIEPFCGSAAVLLKRPAWHFDTPIRVETINDANGWVVNAYRAIRLAPKQTAHYADWPVTELDKHARAAWLKPQEAELTSRLESDPDYYDPKLAGWWLWLAAASIGAPLKGGAWKIVDGRLQKAEPESGVLRDLPHLGNYGQGIQRTAHGASRRAALVTYFQALAQRLERVRITCGDWWRILVPALLYAAFWPIGILLDPPYEHANRDTKQLYRHDAADTDASAWRWALEHGDDPNLRIAYCGYEDGRETPPGWSKYRWKAQGGYSTLRRNGKNDNAHKETIWFSPHCLSMPVQPTLF